jgi:hypothetical protein
MALYHPYPWLLVVEKRKSADNYQLNKQKKEIVSKLETISFFSIP